METKKRLIFRLALACVLLLVASLATLGVALVRETRQRGAHAEWQRQERAAAAERSRKLLAEVAQRVRKLPVDATVLGEAESRYFEEYPRGRVHLWAMGPAGEFLFGVPREAFDKLNAIYDRDVLPRLKDGVFLDRQTFLRRLVDESEDIDGEAFAEAPEEREGEAAEEAADRRARAERAWQRWGRGGDDPDRSFTLSTPLKAADGQALGSLYVKTTVEPERFHRRDEANEALGVFGGGGAGAALFGLWMLLPTWVFVDARGRGVRRAGLWAFLTVLSAVIGLVVYLIARPEDPRALPCPGCGREIDGGAFCPHCGRDLSAAFCAACRYPLKPDWAYCPSCRTEIRPAAPPSAVAAGTAG
jgi:hypothetical protein